MGASESKQQIRKIFDCVDKDNVEGLKLLMNHPQFYQIRDAFGNTMLHRAIIKKSIAVFRFLLSLDDFPINARNYTGKTALEVALCNYRECKWFHKCCIYSLIEKDANLDRIRDKTWLLHRALDDNKVNVARCLIEKGADINSCDRYGRKPLHRIHRVHTLNGDVNELLAMMLYFGTDPSIPDDEDNRVIDYALADDCFSELMQEHLVFYFFDDFCTDYDIPLFTLFSLLQSDPPFAPLVLKHITSVNLDKINYLERNFYFNLRRFTCRPFDNSDDTDYFKELGRYFQKLFIIKPEYLKFLLKKFDYVIEAILDASLKTESVYWPSAKEMFIENIDLLFHSQFGSDLIEVINKIEINFQIERSRCCDFESIMVLLTCGANISDFDLEVVYRRFGDCEFFRMLLHMDIKISDKFHVPCHIMPGLLYDIHMDMETFLSDPKKYKCPGKFLKQLLNYFAHPKLQDLCCRESVQIEDIRAKMDELPSVPLLVELVRNEVRKFLIKKYKIKNSMQFYTLIKHLPISEVHQKIITLETKLY